MSNLRVAAILIVASLVALIALDGTPARARSPECRVTHEAYAALKHGMRYVEAVKILGCKGRPVTHMTIGKIERRTYTWRGTGRYGANINLTFRNQRLTSQSQLGL